MIFELNLMILAKESLKRTSTVCYDTVSVLNDTFVNMKYQIQLTNIFKTAIQGFHKNLKSDKKIL